eukprot:TRINITY_DN12933_c0_g1_i1.p1 TRINITY_DN12933_c0_g1~~TRINITY_DN12933_c0_g1_i1.p1  ORF type:complete len:163 (-),score=15.36 TRINITY_DN12933_c0_g1_i1:52-540(-)
MRPSLPRAAMRWQASSPLGLRRAFMPSSRLLSVRPVLTLAAFDAAVCGTPSPSGPAQHEGSDPAIPCDADSARVAAVLFYADFFDPCGPLRDAFHRWSDDATYSSIRFVEVDVGCVGFKAPFLWADVVMVPTTVVYRDGRFFRCIRGTDQGAVMQALCDAAA